MSKQIMLLLLLSGCAQYSIPDVGKHIIMLEVVKDQNAVIALCDQGSRTLACRKKTGLRGITTIIINRHDWEETIVHEIAHALDINDMSHEVKDE